MSRKCQISGKFANNAYSISHSHIRTKRKQHVNLQKKKIWSILENRWMHVRISTKAMKSLYRMNL
uniref:Large ribosomal subunit protein bL28c n=1 Tax=Porolithon onkodes TaxID=231751 RepID=A0A2Z2KSL7_9FLOR|nr:ribosomal protein L28 [Porolithon onkodes]ASB29779.1 ribosomal protein L28 [Porolithon onkodes]